MLSYKNWKLLEESFGYTLGIKSPQNIASVGNLAGLEEAKAKKKMLEDDAVPADEAPEEEGDEEVADADVDGEGEGDCGCDDKKMCGKGMKKKCCKNMKKEGCEEEDDDDDDDEEELDGDDEGDEEDPDSDAKADGKTLDMPLMMKKKMKKKMKKEAAEVEAEAAKKEHVDTIKKMLASDPQKKNWDGISVKAEDYLIQSGEPAAPGPGEVGYAPQTRFGVGSTVAEWQQIAKRLGC